VWPRSALRSSKNSKSPHDKHRAGFFRLALMRYVMANRASSPAPDR
jgi:hypothetical protein